MAENVSSTPRSPQGSWWHTGLAIPALLVCFIVLNVFAGLASWRLDLTEEQAHTLSEPTRKLLSELSEPIELRLYYTEQLGLDIPVYGNLARRVQNMLAEFARLGNGALRYRVVTPEPFSEAEDRAIGFGLQAVPLNENGDQAFFGIVATNSTDGVEIEPFMQLDREAWLEYDLTRMLHSLSTPKKPVLGLMSWLPIAGTAAMARLTPRIRPTAPWLIYDQLSELFEIRALRAPLDKLPDDLDVLVIIHPKTGQSNGPGDLRLDRATLIAIDRYVLSGRSAVIFVDPLSETDRRLSANLGTPANMATSALPELFRAWGVAYDATKIAADRHNARAIRTSSGANQSDVSIVPYVLWLDLAGDQINRSLPAIATIERLSMIQAGTLGVREGAKLKGTNLAWTGTESMLIDSVRAQTVTEPSQLLAQFQSSGKSFPVAMLFEGEAGTAFPEVNNLDATKNRSIRLAVIADGDMLVDSAWVETRNFFGRPVHIPTAENGAFVVNLIETMAGGTSLSALRGRRVSQRPFTHIEAIKADADKKYRTREQELLDRVRKIESELGQVRRAGDGAVIPDATQQKRLRKLNADFLVARDRLRQAQYDLEADLRGTSLAIQMINILTLPALILVIGLFVPVILRARRRRGRAASSGGRTA